MKDVADNIFGLEINLKSRMNEIEINGKNYPTNYYFTGNDTITIDYDGIEVNYYFNDTLMRTVQASGSYYVAVDIYNNGAGIKDINITGTIVSSIDTSNILFGLGYTTSGSTYTIYKISNIYIYDSDIIVKKLIPAIRNSDSRIGMYDLLSDTFYPGSDNSNYLSSEIKGHILDDGHISKEPTLDEDGEFIYTCSLCHAQIKQIIPSLAFKVNFTYDSGIKEIRVHSNNYLDSEYEITNNTHSRNLFSYNYSKNNCGVYFEIIFNDGYELEENTYNIISLDDMYLLYGIYNDINIDLHTRLINDEE